MKTITTLMKKNCMGCIIFCLLLFTPIVTTGQIRLTVVNPVNAEVTIHNYGSTMIDISGYWFCAQRSYGALALATLVSGSLDLAPGADVTLVVNTAPMALSNSASDLSIYVTNVFGNANNMVDFMQYGASFPGLSGREGEAVSQGLWTAGTFITGEPTTFFYNGDGSQNGVETWDTTLGINDEGLNTVLSIYPNPSDDLLKIRRPQNVSLLRASIFDVTGKLLSSIDLRDADVLSAISLNSIPKGLFFIKITDQQGRTTAKKFIKE